MFVMFSLFLQWCVAKRLRDPLATNLTSTFPCLDKPWDGCYGNTPTNYVREQSVKWFQMRVYVLYIAILSNIWTFGWLFLVGNGATMEIHHFGKIDHHWTWPPFKVKELWLFGGSKIPNFVMFYSILQFIRFGFFIAFAL